MTRPLNDTLQRPLRSLRISVTDRCNMRCGYCMPAAFFNEAYAYIPQQEFLDFQEIRRLVMIFVEFGVDKIRLTGGEPLLRQGLPILIRQLKEIKGIREISMTTNGVLLEHHAAELKTSGLDRITVSLDSLDETIFDSMTGTKGGLSKVLQGIDAVRSHGFTKTKINTVIQKGINESSIIPLYDFAKKQNVELRFIEYMDVGTTNGWTRQAVVTGSEILGLLKKHHSFASLDSQRDSTSSLWEDSQGQIVGFINSVSDPFCGECSRGRLTANGTFHTCLFSTQGLPLGEALKSGIPDHGIAHLIEQCWSLRQDQYSQNRHTLEQTISKIEMSKIGG